MYVVQNPNRSNEAEIFQTLLASDRSLRSPWDVVTALIYRDLKGIGALRHYGVAICRYGRCEVIDLSEDGIQNKTLEVFGMGLPIKIEQKKTISQVLLNSRIEEARKSYSVYSLYGNNCEDFARFIFEGQRGSYQTFVVVGTLLAAGISCLPDKP